MVTVKLPVAVYRHSAQQIFHWRKLMREGALVAVGSDENVVPAVDTG